MYSKSFITFLKNKTHQIWNSKMSPEQQLSVCVDYLVRECMWKDVITVNTDTSHKSIYRKHNSSLLICSTKLCLPPIHSEADDVHLKALKLYQKRTSAEKSWTLTPLYKLKHTETFSAGTFTLGTAVTAERVDFWLWARLVPKSLVFSYYRVPHFK